MGRFLFAAFALVLALPSRGFAQESAYQFTPPAGWQYTFADNRLGVFVKPNDPDAAGVTLLLLPVMPHAIAIEQEARIVLKTMETSLGLKEGGVAPVQLNGAQAGDQVVLMGAYVNNAGATLYLGLYARAEKGALGSLVLLATSADAFQRYGVTALALFNSLHLTDRGAKIAGGQSAQAQPQAQPQPQFQGQTPSSTSPLAPAGPPEGGGIAIPTTGTLTRDASLRDLVGIWVGQAAITYTSTTWGAGFKPSYYTSHSYGAGGQFLKVRPDGGYELFHNLIMSGCSYLKNYKGKLSVQNGQVTMRHTAGRESQGPAAPNETCNKEKYDRETVPPPDAFAVELHNQDTVRGFPTYRLLLKSVAQNGQNFQFDRLDGRPLPAATPPMTRNYQLGAGHAARDLQGVWAAPDDTPANFTLNAQDDGAYRSVLRLLADGRYEMIVRRPDVLMTPTCVKHLRLVELGEALLAGEIDRYDNKKEGGALVLKPSQSRLTVLVTNCGPENSERVYDLPAAPRYLRWRLNMRNPVTEAPLAGDRLEVNCPEPGEEEPAWGFLSCPAKAAQIFSYVRR